MKLSYHNLIEICVFFLIAFTPLAFGSVGLGPQIILVSVSELIFFLWLADAVKAGQFDFKSNIFIYLFAAFLALIIFQLIPLPKFLLKILSPSTYKLYLEFLPGYAEQNMWRSISVYPDATRAEFLKISSYGLVCFVILRVFKTKERITRVLTAISITGFAVALFGIIQKFTWNGMIYWVQPVPEGAGPFGPFVNKNHFAGLMELAIPVTAALIFIVDKIEKKIFFGFMATVELLALFLCLSRAGISSFFAALIFMFLVVLPRRKKKYLFYILPPAAAVSIFIFYITKGPLIARFSSAPEAFLSRFMVYKDTFSMFLNFPLFGAGSGCFGSIFSIYKTKPMDILYKNAHSDWMQFLSETGIIGFLCIAIFIWLFFKDILGCHFFGKCSCALGGSKRHDRFVILIIIAGFVSLISILFHGIFDINLNIPSNALLACVIGTILMAAAHSEFHSK